MAGLNGGNQPAGGNRGDLIIVDGIGALRGDILCRTVLKCGGDKELVSAAVGEYDHLRGVSYRLH